MIVVADTSPLNYLIRSGHVWILPEMFGRVLIPNAVRLEIMHPGAPIEVREFAELPPSWLECVDVSGKLENIRRQLGAGEREAITLALELAADVILIDDLAGRLEAEERRIPARGTLAVLMQAAWRGYLDFRSALDRIKELGFRTTAHLEQSLLEDYHRGLDQ
jgi:predicted nucleic acid-binding protein